MKSLLFATLAKSLQLLNGSLIIILSAIYLDKSNQGLLLTLNSFAAVQIFFELGFASVILQYVGHEKQHLTFDNALEFNGNSKNIQRLASIYRLASSWFNWGGLGCSCLLLIGGAIFFYDSEVSHWFIPLLALAISVPLNLYSQKYWVVYEGFGYINYIYKLRTLSAAASLITIISLFYFGNGLITPAVSSFFTFLFSQFLRLHKSEFWNSLKNIKNEKKQTLIFFKEILSLQSRVSISYLCGFFMFQSITPIIYKVSGAEDAAIVGIGMSAILILNSLLSTLVQIKIPHLLGLINKKEIFSYFDYGYKLIKITVIIAIILSIFGGLFIYSLRFFSFNWLATRLPDLPTYICLMVASIINQIVSIQATLTRLFKVEPYLFHSIILAVTTVVTMIFAASIGGPLQIAFSFLVITLIISLPSSTFIFISERKKRTR